MPDNIPSLSEISNVNTDAGTSGIAPEPVIDNSKLVEGLNSAAKFHAQQVANKYNTFLQNKKDMYANIGDIQSLETLPEDKEVLRKQAADIFEQIGKDPSTVTGGRGFDEVQAKMSKFKSDSMASKQRFLENKANRVLFETTPEMDTPENRKKLKDYIDGGLYAKAPLFDTPTIMDERSIFEKTLTDSTHPYTENRVGADGMHYIDTGFEFNPKAFSSQWGLIGGQTDKNNKQLAGAIKYNYDHLPKAQKDKYEEDGGGGIDQYWKDRGNAYLNAHIPEGSYDKTDNGNVRFGKTSKQDTEWLTQQRLLQQEKHQVETERQGRERIAAEWASIDLRSKDFNKLHGEDKNDTRTVIGSVVDDFANAENVTAPTGEKDANGKPVTKTLMRIKDVPFLKSMGLVGKDGKVNGAIDYDPENDKLIVQKINSDGAVTQSNPVSADTWLTTKTKFFTAEKKDIGGISSSIQDLKEKGGGTILGMVNYAKQLQQEQKDNPPAKSGKQNDASYYGDEKNVVSQKGDIFTYKDGTQWQYKNGKFKKIK